MTGRLLTAREVAEDLALVPETVLAWAREGKLPRIVLPSGQIRFRPADMDAWLEARSTSGVGSRLTVINGGEPS